MSVQLLDKTRKINKLLHNNHSHKVVFNDICEVLSDILESNILVISKKGKVLGVAIHEGVDEIEELIKDQVGGFVDRMLNERLLSVLSTKENVNLATLGFAEENVKKYQAIITPIDISGEPKQTRSPATEPIMIAPSASVTSQPAVIATSPASEADRKSTRLNSSHVALSRMPSSA